MLSQTQAADVTNTFEPAWWCRGATAQTVFGGLFRRVSQVDYQRERLELPDGDFVDLDWTEKKASARILILLPGLGGSSDDGYIKNVAAQASNDGWNVVVLNARGRSGELNRLNVTHHGGRTGDLDFLIQKLIAENARAEIFLAGFSLGGNAMLKWLGEKKDAVPPQVKKTVAVSTPCDLKKTSEQLDRGFNREVYARNLLRDLKRQALDMEARAPGILDREKVRRAQTFRIYDREVTARLNGFKDEEEYWRESSSAAYLDAIRVPTLVIHAANDPFLPARFMPLGTMRRSESITLLLTKDGGHLGFIGGSSPWKQEPWLEKTILNFLNKENL